MEKTIQNRAVYQRANKIILFFLLIIIAVLIFLGSVLRTISSDRRIPSHNTTIYDRSFRGAIISEDGYTLSSSQKSYQAVIRGASIEPDKKGLFVKLFSIYSNIPEEEIWGKFKNKKGKEIKGNIILSKTVNARSAMQLKALAYKLRQLDVFRPIKTRSGIEVLFGLDIVENGESRRFPLIDVLSPVLGYVGDKSDGIYTRPAGKKGLERAYEKHITSKKNGYFRGKRDVAGAVIHDGNSANVERVDGLNLHLNIPLALQRRIEKMVDQMKEEIDAQEILVGIMESHTGRVRALASSERYNPAHITQNDIAALNPKFAEYPYEAGSVIKPITMSLALDHHYVTPGTWFNTYNGKMKISARHTITDDDKFPALTCTDIIVHSSNVGISQVSWRLSGKEFRDGLLGFGFSQPSGIDLSRDLPGRIKSQKLLDHKMHRANSSYGYGMVVTFAQLFKAYSAFNNDGIAVTPRLVDYLADDEGKHYTLPPKVEDRQAIHKKAANQIHEILKEVVKRGTGVKAQYPGLEIGGKTGTAHIAKNGHYVREYHSSFYGFANDKKGHKYTIGVLVIRAKKRYKYFASLSAVPTFKKAVGALVELGYLEPEEIAPKEEPLPVTSTPKKRIRKEVKIQKEPVVTQPPKAKPTPQTQRNGATSSVMSLFNMKTKPSTKKVKQTRKKRLKKPPPRRTKKPIQKKSVHELFDDVF